MNTFVIEHVALDGLPAEWRARMQVPPNARVSVRIQEEVPDQPVQANLADNPMFGMWQDRQDMADVASWLGRQRAPRHLADGSRREGWMY